MRLIDADALMEELVAIQSVTYMSTCASKDECMGKRWMIARAIDAVKDAREVNAVPVVRGEWIENQTKDSVLCSYCHADWNMFDNDTYRFCYCPNCGAKMEDKPCG